MLARETSGQVPASVVVFTTRFVHSLLEYRKARLFRTNLWSGHIPSVGGDPIQGKRD